MHFHRGQVSWAWNGGVTGRGPTGGLQVVFKAGKTGGHVGVCYYHVLFVHLCFVHFPTFMYIS